MYILDNLKYILHIQNETFSLFYSIIIHKGGNYIMVHCIAL